MNKIYKGCNILEKNSIHGGNNTISLGRIQHSRKKITMKEIGIKDL